MFAIGKHELFGQIEFSFDVRVSAYSVYLRCLELLCIIIIMYIIIMYNN